MTMKVMCKAVQWKDEYAVEIEAEDKASAAREFLDTHHTKCAITTEQPGMCAVHVRQKDEPASQSDVLYFRRRWDFTSHERADLSPVAMTKYECMFMDCQEDPCHVLSPTADGPHAAVKQYVDDYYQAHGHEPGFDFGVEYVLVREAGARSGFVVKYATSRPANLRKRTATAVPTLELVIVASGVPWTTDRETLTLRYMEYGGPEVLSFIMC